MSRTISAKVNDELLERIEEAREGEPPDQESRSATIERLIRDGLNTSDTRTDPLPVVLMWGGSVAIATQYASATGLIGPLGIAAMLAGYLLTYESVNDRVRGVFAGSTDSET
jgi:hypothetical protein